ncbi:hypothetical protein, partial [Staphylococcus capitis]|uniref:hypothetical protein n=1 Tax=Staphylococcus capitis TaxID=29388 RepID=UPI001C92C2CD
LGLTEPNLLSIPNTKLPHSPHLINNHPITNNPIIHNTIPIPMSFNTPNNSLSAHIFNTSPSFFPLSIPTTPNTLNQTKLTTPPTTKTPQINSPIQRPFQTRPMNTPTNPL